MKPKRSLGRHEIVQRDTMAAIDSLLTLRLSIQDTVESDGQDQEILTRAEAIAGALARLHGDIEAWNWTP